MTVKDKYNKTIQEIEERVSDPLLSNQEIAEGVARSNALIFRDMVAVFKYMTGSTLRGYISERKMMASYRYLIQAKTRNIEQALEIAGYSDQPSYTKAFKAQFGISPGEAYKRKDASLLTAPLTWEVLSTEADSSLPVEEEIPAMTETMRFGITEAQYAKAAEAMELEAFYDFTPFISQYAFELSDRIGKPLKDTFRFVDSFRDYVEQHSEKDDNPDAPGGPIITQDQILHEYGDSVFYQRMFFERGISAETISYFQMAHDATEEELLECEPEMLAAYDETYDMSFHFFMRAWRRYMEYTDGKYNSYEFESYLKLLDSWIPIDVALENMEDDLSDEEIMDALHESLDPRSVALDIYYSDIDDAMERAYNHWDGSRIDEEPDIDNLGYQNDDHPIDMDSYSYDDEDRPVEMWDAWERKIFSRGDFFRLGFLSFLVLSRTRFFFLSLLYSTHN